MNGCIRCHGPTDHNGNCERCNRERKALGPSDASSSMTHTKEETRDVILFQRPDGLYLKEEDIGGGPGGGTMVTWVADPCDALMQGDWRPDVSLREATYYLGEWRGHGKDLKPVRAKLHTTRIVSIYDDNSTR